MAYVVGIDIGGTCTDCVVLDEQGRTTIGKAFSTPPDFSRGILDAVDVAAASLDVAGTDLLAETRLFLHSTTVAENAVVDGNLARAGLLTSQGFTSTLFATRGGYGRWSGLTEDEKRNPMETDKPVPLVPIDRVRGVRDRIDHRGVVLAAVDEAEIEAAVRDLLDRDIEALAISLLWSFVNRDNELKVLDVVRRVAPELFVTASHDIAPTSGEYERTSTVALNASLGPVVTRYLDNLVTGLRGRGFAGLMLVMQAYGGLLPLEQAVRRPVGMLESGPVSGLMGCKRLGDQIGFEDIISADMGGTTFKIGTVREGLIEYQRESMVLRYHYSLPKMDVTSLGVAGGSIVSLDPKTGAPNLGPRSAGSYPGPVCYDHGGDEPTLTDVDAVLGFLDSRYFLGGRAELNIDKARARFTERIAAPLRMDTEEAAAAVYTLGNSVLSDLVHKTTVQRGLNPRDFALFSTGGTAGMHMPILGAELGVRSVVIPHSASVHGAYGLVTSDVVHEELVTKPMAEPFEPAAIGAIFDEMSATATTQLAEEGFTGDRIQLAAAVDMRYRRQVHIITVPVEVTVPIDTSGPVTQKTVEQTVETFETLYKQKYGRESTFRAAGIEMVGCRLRATGYVTKPKVATEKPSGVDSTAALVERRRAYIPDTGEFGDVAAYDFSRLRAGNEIAGPAIIWTPTTTVVVGARQRARCDQHKNVVVTS
jgi:N-methylhydantoinase A